MCGGAPQPEVPLTAATEVLWGGNAEPWGTHPCSEQIDGRKGSYQGLLCNSFSIFPGSRLVMLVILLVMIKA